jgi:hypothetical protein
VQRVIINLEPPLVRRLDEWAERELRPRSNAVAWIITRFLDGLRNDPLTGGLLGGLCEAREPKKGIMRLCTEPAVAVVAFPPNYDGPGAVVLTLPEDEATATPREPAQPKLSRRCTRHLRRDYADATPLP